MDDRKITVGSSAMLEMRGRSGYVSLRSAHIWSSMGKLYVDLWSTRAGQNPPVRIEGSAKEVLLFLKRLFFESLEVAGDEARLFAMQGVHHTGKDA